MNQEALHHGSGGSDHVGADADVASWMVDTCAAPAIESYYGAGGYLAGAGGTYGYEALAPAPVSLGALSGGVLT